MKEIKLKIIKEVLPALKKTRMGERYQNIDIYWSYDFKEGSYGELLVEQWFLFYIYHKNINALITRWDTQEILKYRLNVLRLIEFIKKQYKLGYVRFYDNENQDDFIPYIREGKVYFEVSGYLEKIYKNENGSFDFLKHLIDHNIPSKIILK